jgi:hypothetical protein
MVPRNDSDHDGVEDLHDNCLFEANASQVDCDGDGFGDACDICASEKDERDLKGAPVDRDEDAVPDACDLNGNGRDITAWKKFKAKRQGQTLFFARPLLGGWYEHGDWVWTGGVNAFLQGNLDPWRFSSELVPGVDTPVIDAVPPSLYWRAGVYWDPSDDSVVGAIVGVDYRPLGSDRLLASVFGYMTVGLQLQFLYGGASATADRNVPGNLGTGLKVAFFDVLSLVPFLQIDVMNGNDASGGVLLYFDLAILGDLGVDKVIPFHYQM